MDVELSRLLGGIVLGQTVAALATLHDGAPFASMIPFATWLDAGGQLRFVTHVSRLSAHTRDMLESPRVCLLITAPPDDVSAEIVPQALPRVSIPAVATFIDPRHPDHDPLARAYLAKFPLTEEQRRAVLDRDWIGMVRLGANIYHLSKLGGTDRKTFQYMAGCMTGMTQEDYRAMLIRAGSASGMQLPPQLMQMAQIASTPSLFDAIDGLGLKMDSRKVPLDVIVVEQVSKTPTEN